MATNGGYLSRDAILEADDLEFADVPVPEWGGTVRIRALSAAERIRVVGIAQTRDSQDGLEIEQEVDGNKVTVRLHPDFWPTVLAFACVDENGQAIFSREDVIRLGMKASEPVQRVAGEVMRISGMDAGAAEDAGKDSTEAESSASPSA